METSKKHLGIWEYEKIWRVEEVNLDRNQLMMVKHWGMIFGFKKGEIQSMIVITYMITATLIRASALDGTARVLFGLEPTLKPADLAEDGLHLQLDDETITFNGRCCRLLQSFAMCWICVGPACQAHLSGMGERGTYP